MKTIHKLIRLIADFCFPHPNFANENNPIPMVGEQHDFRAMVLALLGLPTEATTDMVNEKYLAAMNVPLNNGNEMDDETRCKLEVAELAHAANVELKKRLDAALAANAAPQEVKIKIGDKEVNAANAEEVNTALAAVNDRVVKAEALAANSRQSLRKFILTALVKEGRLTKKESDEEDKKLSGPEFANAEQFDARVTELAKRSSAFGTTSSIFEMLNGLGEAANNKAATATASSEFLNMVNAEMVSSGKSYEQAWTAVSKTEKGKGLLASMKKPVK